MEQLDLFSSMAAADQEKNEYLDLVKKLNHFAELYYAKDEPEISDYEYDSMNNRLKEIEKEHPDWIVPVFIEPSDFGCTSAYVSRPSTFSDSLTRALAASCSTKDATLAASSSLALKLTPR